MTDSQMALIDALTSGEYTQGQNMLETQDGCFCCLGVACMVYEQQTGTNIKRDSFGQLIGGSLYEYPEVVEWFKFFDKWGGGHIKKSSMESLDCLNDTGLTFDQIAEELSTGKYWKE